MTLWAWAVAAYAQDGVDEACLDLQDGYDQNIPYLLWAAWAAVHGRSLDAETLEMGAETCRAWDDAAISPLRTIRRRLKKPVTDMGDEAREAIRTQVKAVELAAERGLLDDLETLAPKAVGAPRPVSQGLIEAAKAWARVLPRAQLEALGSALQNQG